MKKILDIFLKTKEEDSKIINLKLRDYNKTPVFLFFFTIIILVNFISFFLGKNEPFNQIHLLFGANQSYLFLNYYQIWRIFSYPFFQNVSTLMKTVLSFFFVFLTYRILGFYFEVFLKPKKTLFVLLLGIPLIGMISSVFPISDDIFLFGSEWICWLLIGGFLFVIMNKKESPQSLKLIKWTLFKVSIILIGILIYRYTNSRSDLNIESDTSPSDDKFNLKPSFYFLMPIITLTLGFFLTLIAHYKEFEDRMIFNILLIFIITLCLIILIFYINYYVDLFNGRLDTKETSSSNIAIKINNKLKEILNFKE